MMRISPAPISLKNRRGDDGFTLLELIIVILLVSIFLTFASVNWNGVSSKGSDALFERLSIAVSFLREEAVSKYEERVIEFDVTAGKILFGYVDQKLGFTKTGEIPLSEDYQLKDVVINGEKFSTGKGYMTFFGSGMVDRAIIHLQGKDENYSLLVNPLTAKLTGERGYVEETSIE
jgi:prepilin-type N-terminal cleavage/methylation domain-containing protein